MLAFLDTEFTDLVIRPRLLSVGVVTARAGQQAFYAEVTDRDRIHATHWFGLAAVLPQFGKVNGAACTYAELGARLSTYLAALVADLPRDDAAGHVEPAFGYHLDWELVDRAIEDAHCCVTCARRVQPQQNA